MTAACFLSKSNTIARKPARGPWRIKLGQGLTNPFPFGSWCAGRGFLSFADDICAVMNEDEKEDDEREKGE